MRQIKRLLRRVSGADRGVALMVLSFPKSGRTWHRVLLGRYLTLLTGRPETAALDLKQLCKDALLGRIVYSHNGANFTDDVRFDDPRVADASEWAGQPVLLLVRDPRDVLVSAFHHAKFRDRIFAGEISEFIRSPTTGIDKVLTALNRWSERRGEASAFEVLAYEDMHSAPGACLQRTLRCLGLRPDPRFVEDAVAFASFDNMKRYEERNIFGDERMARTSESEEGAKVRAGKVGGYRNHLAPDDLAYIQARVDALGDPFASAYHGGSGERRRP